MEDFGWERKEGEETVCVLDPESVAFQFLGIFSEKLESLPGLEQST